MKKSIFLTVLFITLTIFSCVKNDEYEIPTSSGEEPEIILNSAIEAVKNAWNQHYLGTGKLIYTFPNLTNTYFEGYVISSDLAGNFYKSLVIQNDFENANHGIEILINKTSLFETYEFGRKVYVKLDGLSISYEDGVDNDPTDANPGRYTLGIEKGGTIDEIPTSLYLDHIIRSTEVVEIIPNEISVISFDQNSINTFVKVQNLQFEISQLGKTYAGESSDSFDGFRTLLSCDDLLTTPLQTSTFCDFKSYVIPNGQGSLNAILAKDFRADYFVLTVNDPTAIDFSNAERCDPETLDCGNNLVGGTEVIFNENFDDTSKSKLAADGWTNTNINGGGEVFELKKSGENSFMQAAAYNSDESPMEVWLVSPPINLDNFVGEELTFKTQAGYYQGDALSVFISTDFSGDVTAATWVLLDADLVDGPPSGYGGTFLSSGSINLSCLEGDVFIGFRYLGADGVITTTFRIDHVRVVGGL